MNRRELDFRDFDALLADIQRLHEQGYEKAGQWNLGQICKHLSITMEMSLEGFPFKGPWLFRKVIGPFVKPRFFRSRKIKPGLPAPPTMVAEPDSDEGQAIEQLKQITTRVREHRGEFQPHPFFEYLSPEQWLQLHLIHAAHHLSFLILR